jgi:prepilin-type N-terminal cleavage/methylation domain-containing protein/prepilin-type processing-associated H-X9-DG protein
MATEATPPLASRPRLENHRGFTLLELLVVITIIAVLAALLLPVLANAKAGARQIVCLNEMRQWAVAFFLYVDENEGWIPREGYRADGEVEWVTWAQVQAVKDPWYNALPPLIKKRPASDYVNPSQWNAFYSRSSFFHCPSARFPSETRNELKQYPLFSRAMNSQLIGSPNVRGSIRFDTIRDKVRTPLFLDNRLKGEKKMPGQEERFLGQPSAFATRFAVGRHPQGGNLVFADGNGKCLRGEEVVNTNGLAILPPQKVVWEANPN